MIQEVNILWRPKTKEYNEFTNWQPNSYVYIGKIATSYQHSTNMIVRNLPKVNTKFTELWNAELSLSDEYMKKENYKQKL